MLHINELLRGLASKKLRATFRSNRSQSFVTRSEEQHCSCHAKVRKRIPLASLVSVSVILMAALVAWLGILGYTTRWAALCYVMTSVSNVDPTLQMITDQYQYYAVTSSELVSVSLFTTHTPELSCFLSCYMLDLVSSVWAELFSKRFI